MDSKKMIAIAIALTMVFCPVSYGLTINDDHSVNGQQQQGQQQGQLQGQAQGQLQGQAQAAIAAQGQMQGNLNKNQGNQGQADVNIRYEDRFQFPSHSGLAAASGTDTAQMSIAGLTLSDTAPHVVASTKMQILGLALEAGILSADEVRTEVLQMIDQLNVQTRPKRIFSWGPRTSGKHLFNLFGIIATDSYRGNSPEVDKDEGDEGADE